MDDQPIVHIGGASYNNSQEGDCGAAVPVYLDHPSSQQIIVHYASVIQFSTPTEQWWYGQTFGTLIFEPGLTCQWVSVDQVNPAPSDSFSGSFLSDWGSQTAVVELTSADGAVIGQRVAHLVLRGDEIEPGLFILPGGFTLEPNPDKELKGEVVATLGNWRLIKNQTLSGYYRDGVCTSYDGKDYVACMRYSQQRGSSPYAVYGKVGNGKFEKIADWDFGPGFCWYNKGTLVGFVRVFDPSGTAQYVIYDGRDWSSQSVSADIGDPDLYTYVSLDAFDILNQATQEFSIDGSESYYRCSENIAAEYPGSPNQTVFGDACARYTAKITFDEGLAASPFTGYTYSEGGEFYESPYDFYYYERSSNTHVRAGLSGRWLWDRQTDVNVSLPSDRSYHNSLIVTTESLEEGVYYNGYFYEYYDEFADTKTAGSFSSSSSTIPGYETWGSVSAFDFSNSGGLYWQFHVPDFMYNQTVGYTYSAEGNWARNAAIGLITSISSQITGPGSVVENGNPTGAEPTYDYSFTHSIAGMDSTMFLFVCSTVTIDKACLILGLTNVDDMLDEWFDIPEFPATHASPHKLYGYDGTAITDLSALLSYVYGEIDPTIYNASITHAWRDPRDFPSYLSLPATRAKSIIQN